jgi:hypothetical protein
VTDTGIFKSNHQVWQRANIAAATAYLREVLARDPDNARVKAIYEGLLDVVEPTRRNERQQGAAGAPQGLERRSGGNRRSGKDRRKG